MKEKIIKILDMLGLTELLVKQIIVKFGAKGLADLILKSESESDDKLAVEFAKELLDRLQK